MKTNSPPSAVNSPAPTGRTRTAQGKERSDAALSHTPQNTPSPEGVKQGGELPNGWHVDKLNNIAVKIGSGSTPRGGEAVYKSRGVPLIRSMNVHFCGFKPDLFTSIKPKRKNWSR